MSFQVYLRDTHGGSIHCGALEVNDIIRVLLCERLILPIQARSSDNPNDFRYIFAVYENDQNMADIKEWAKTMDLVARPGRQNLSVRTDSMSLHTQIRQQSQLAQAGHQSQLAQTGHQSQLAQTGARAGYTDKKRPLDPGAVRSPSKRDKPSAKAEQSKEHTDDQWRKFVGNVKSDAARGTEHLTQRLIRGQKRLEKAKKDKEHLTQRLIRGQKRLEKAKKDKELLKTDNTGLKQFLEKGEQGKKHLKQLLEEGEQGKKHLEQTIKYLQDSQVKRKPTAPLTTSLALLSPTPQPSMLVESQVAALKRKIDRQDTQIAAKDAEIAAKDAEIAANDRLAKAQELQAEIAEKMLDATIKGPGPSPDEYTELETELLITQVELSSTKDLLIAAKNAEKRLQQEIRTLKSIAESNEKLHGELVKDNECLQQTVAELNAWKPPPPPPPPPSSSPPSSPSFPSFGQ